jgi:hypothetical protein
MNLHSGARSCPASRALLIERVRRGTRISDAARAAGISRRSAYKWIARHAADRVGKLDAKLRTFTTKSQLLIVDEVGYLPLSRAKANYLFQVVSHRYERSSVILTSNKSVTEWPEVFGDHATRRPEYRRFLKRLRAARERAGLTQVEVARRLRVPQSYVSKSESGERARGRRGIG